MSKKQSPFHGYSQEEVFRMENHFFCLEFGGDFYIEDGSYLFTKSEISRLYSGTIRDLISLLESGSDQDKKYALDTIPRLIVRPLRLH